VSASEPPNASLMIRTEHGRWRGYFFNLSSGIRVDRKRLGPGHKVAPYECFAKSALVRLLEKSFELPTKDMPRQNCIEMQLVCRHTQTAELLTTCGPKLVVN
jgi:hypothetical protein